MHATYARVNEIFIIERIYIMCKSEEIIMYFFLCEYVCKDQV